jgi:hypothetical protein
MQEIERVLDVGKKEVYGSEFWVYASLEFQLFLPLAEISPHMNRILSGNGMEKGTFLEAAKMQSV